MSEVPEFGKIPGIDEDPVYRLNEIANPLGHTAEYEGDFIRIRPTGAVPNHQCQHLATDFQDGKRYLAHRATHTEWTLDMQDTRYEVERASGSGMVVLVDVETGQRSAPIPGGVGGRRNDDGDRVTSFFVTSDAPPAVGRWYR